MVDRLRFRGGKMWVWLVAPTLLVIAGCQGTPVYYHQSTLKQVVVLDHREISVLPLGDNVWEAYGGKQGGTSPADLAAQQTRQIQAIEKVSGCTVTSSEYGDSADPGRLLLRARVDCSRRLGG